MRNVHLISAVLIVLSPALIACEASRGITPSLNHALPVTSVTEAYGQIQKNGVMVQGRKWKVEKTIDSRGVTIDYELLPGQPSLDDLGADHQTKGVETELPQQGAKMTPVLKRNIAASPQYVAVCGGGPCASSTGGDAIVGSCGTDCFFLSTIYFGIQDNGDATPAQLCQAWRNYSYSQQTRDCFYITQDLTTLASNEYDLDGVFVTYGICHAGKYTFDRSSNIFFLGPCSYNMQSPNTLFVTAKFYALDYLYGGNSELLPITTIPPYTPGKINTRAHAPSNFQKIVTSYLKIAVTDNFFSSTAGGGRSVGSPIN